MPTPTSTARVLLISDPGPTQEQITAALRAQPGAASQDFTLLDVISSPENLGREISRHNPDMIILDHTLGGQPTIDLMDDMAAQFPETGIVAILPGLDPSEAQQAMLAGARAFIMIPFTQINLLSTLRRVHNLEVRRSQTRTASTSRPVVDTGKPVRVVSVYSPRGGSGTSTVAANLAVALQAETGMRVLLLEGKLFFGHISVMLNIRSQNTLSDLIPHAANLDEGLVKEVVSEHVSGIEVLLAPTNMQIAQGIRPEDVYNIFMSLNRIYDYIVIDVGSTLNETSVTLLDVADRALVIANPDLASLQDVSRFIQLTWGLSYPVDKVLVVLNREKIPGGIRSADAASALRQNIFAHIPDEGPLALRSLNSGVPLITRYPRSGAAKAFKEIAKKLMALTSLGGVGRTGAHETDPSRREALLASSQFG